VVRKRNANCTGWRVAERDQTRDVGLNLLDVRRQRLEQALAGLCRGDAARGSGQEADAESNFKLLDRVAQG
jgi:hypothetical protein